MKVGLVVEFDEIIGVIEAEAGTGIGTEEDVKTGATEVAAGPGACGFIETAMSA